MGLRFSAFVMDSNLLIVRISTKDYGTTGGVFGDKKFRLTYKHRNYNCYGIIF